VAAVNLRWLYLVAFTPILTDLIERGALPTAPGGWITEVVSGLIVLALVHRVRMQYRDVLALARTDALTGLLNRRVFEEAVQDECARARRFGDPLCVVYLDVDGFKGINDRFGHKEGDRVLQLLAGGLREVIRARVDRGFRLGGDEFALLLPGSDTRHAAEVVGRVRRSCAGSDCAPTVGCWSISAGVVALRQNETHSELVERADREMYRQKQARTGARSALLRGRAAAPLVYRLAEFQPESEAVSPSGHQDRDARGPRQVA
jgi:diguanylate cyclase (GGDEF)-like protein